MIDGQLWINWEGKCRTSAIPLLQSLYRSDGLRRFRREICKHKIMNMALSNEHEIVSSHTRPVHCISLEKNDNQFLLSGGLDGLVALYDLNVSEKNKSNPRRHSIRSISMACNSLRERALVSSTGPTLVCRYFIDQLVPSRFWIICCNRFRWQS